MARPRRSLLLEALERGHLRQPPRAIEHAFRGSSRRGESGTSEGRPAIRRRTRRRALSASAASRYAGLATASFRGDLAGSQGARGLRNRRSVPSGRPSGRSNAASSRSRAASANCLSRETKRPAPGDARVERVALERFVEQAARLASHALEEQARDEHRS